MPSAVPAIYAHPVAIYLVETRKAQFAEVVASVDVWEVAGLQELRNEGDPFGPGYVLGDEKGFAGDFEIGFVLDQSGVGEEEAKGAFVELALLTF